MMQILPALYRSILPILCLSLMSVHADAVKLQGKAWPSDPLTLVDVFNGGEGGYECIRIPGLLVTGKGTVLAFAEGRESSKDHAANDIVMKRSEDGGRTWEPLVTLADNGRNSNNNPVPVQDQRSGRIFLMYQSYPEGVAEFDGTIKPGLSGDGVALNYVMHSDDDGQTWSKPENITAATKRPYATSFSGGPGAGIQLQRGLHKGRLVIPFNEGPVGQWNVYSVYSDDGGRSWQMGDNAPGAIVAGPGGKMVSQVNEVQMAELSDGSIILNTRDQGKVSPYRKIALSSDGGQSWSAIKEESQLQAPPCAASVLSYQPDLLLYSGPNHERGRFRGTIHYSRDDGKTWGGSKLLEPARFGYSVLGSLPDGRILCLYETGRRRTDEKVRLAIIDPQWLFATPMAGQ